MIKKLSEEEIQSLKAIQDSFLQLTAQLGQLSLERLSLDMAIDENGESQEKLKDLFIQLKKDESKIQESFGTKYGTGSVNLETGEFTTDV